MDFPGETIRDQGDGQVFPINQVFAPGMPPVQVAPFGAGRVELVKKVVYAVMEEGAVGVIHPVGWWGEVIAWVPGVRLGSGDVLLEYARSFRMFIVHVANLVFEGR